MTQQQIAQAVQAQRQFFATGQTLPRAFRARALDTLKAAILRHESDIEAALRADLGKSRMEGYLCETSMTLAEIGWMRRHLAGLMRARPAHTPLAQFAACSWQSPAPYGVTLIMSPWNYPLLLTLEPLVDALAAGNTAVVKPSAYAPAASAVIGAILAECFPPEYVFVVTGGRAENQALLEQKFDKIFFTGGKTVGREVLRHAAEHLTPVTLELGGKSPCIVDATADLRLAARRIVFGKYLNCGQTCVAPDYLYCQASVRDERKHFDRLRALIDPARVAAGGQADEGALRIAPTVLTDVTFDDPVMAEEIFGPILPVLTWQTLNEAIAAVESRPHPLALYLFTASKAARKQVLAHCRFGGGCVNDTIIHLATSGLPFGGVGESGMGGYHGRAGFAEFSHTRGIVDKKTWFDLPIRYQPYTGWKERLARLFLR